MTICECQVHLVSKDNFPFLTSIPKFTLCKDNVYRAHSGVEGIMQKRVLIDLTQLMKEGCIELVLIEFTQLPKHFFKFTVLTKPLLV